MRTVILKWNPAFSSSSTFHSLQSIIEANIEGEMYLNWSVWDWEKVKPGDRWYLVKVGYGATGIVATGEVISEPWQGEDWSGKGRVTHYVNLCAEMYINHDTLPILTSETLTAHIPEFDWDRGHSGVVLDKDVAAKLEQLWEAYIDENREQLEVAAKASLLHNEDKIFWEDFEL